MYFPVSLSWRKCDILHFHAVWQTDTNTSYMTVGATSNLSGLLGYIREETLCYCWLKQWHIAYPVPRQNLNQYGLTIIYFCKLSYDDSPKMPNGSLYQNKHFYPTRTLNIYISTFNISAFFAFGTASWGDKATCYLLPQTFWTCVPLNPSTI